MVQKKILRSEKVLVPKYASTIFHLGMKIKDVARIPANVRKIIFESLVASEILVIEKDPGAIYKIYPTLKDIEARYGQKWQLSGDLKKRFTISL